MGRKAWCPKVGVNRGAWSLEEDEVLSNYIQLHGQGKWATLPQRAGLNRCGKSCRLRWMNYLRPDIKRGDISPEEEDLIIRLHRLLGNRWSLIAGRLPGRTDNEIKNYWNSVLAKKLNADVPKALKNSEDKKSVGSSSDIIITPNVIVPKATRCTNILLSFYEAQHLKNNQCPPSSTSVHINDGLTWESQKDKSVLNMYDTLDYLDFSRTAIEDVFENSNLLENHHHHELEPMFGKEFDNLTSTLELEDENWRDML